MIPKCKQERNKTNQLENKIDNIISRISGYGVAAQIIKDPDKLGTESRFYRYNGNYGGALPGEWYFIIHLGHYDASGNYCRQIWFSYSEMTGVYSRTQMQGAWSGFRKISLV